MNNYSDEKQLSKKEIQIILLKMLDDFVKYCEKYNLRYYMVGGTLLGAVRHHGFIPWDDDIDLGMPRPDYQRFLELIKTDPVSEDYEVVSSEYGTLTIPLTEIVNKKVRLERDSSDFIAEQYQMLNLFIDIIPQDGWPENLHEAENLVKKMDHLRFMNQVSRAKLGHGKTLLRTIAKIPYGLYVKTIGNKRILEKIREESLKYDYDTSEYVGCVSYGIYGVGERCLRQEVVEFQLIEFETGKYNAPGCWDSYLRGIYGDKYMELPPENKRKTHDMKAYCSDEYFRRVNAIAK